MSAAVTITLGATEWLLLAVVPFLVLCAVVMFAALLRGPGRGAFRLTLPWGGWLFLAFPSLVAGLWGIVRVLVGA